MNTATDGSIILFPLASGVPDAQSIVAWLNTLTGANDGPLTSEAVAAGAPWGMNPDVRAYAEMLLPRNLRDNDLEGIADAALAFVKDNLAYVPDPLDTEYVKSPLVMLHNIVHKGRDFGDCDDHCVLLASILRTLGIDARIVGVRERSDSEWFDHVIVLASLYGGGPYKFMDPCAKGVAQPDYSRREIMFA